MAAEDYFPEDWEQKELGLISLSRRPRTTCNRCGQGRLHWSYNGEHWRLHTALGELHTCVRPNVKVDLSQVMSPTTQAFNPKESIMDKNAVAFIRNDVRSLSVAFVDSEKGSSEEYTPEALRQRVMPYQKYTYLTIDPNIQPGDWVLVEVKGIVKTVYVTAVSDELSIEPNAPIPYKYIVGRVDLTPYQALLAQNAKIHEMLRTSYQASIREGFRQTLLNGLPEDQRNSISLLLSKD